MRGEFLYLRGFSSIELLVVCVILVLVAAVSIPFYGRIRRRTELRSAAMEIGTTLVAARMKAVRYNSTVRVVASPQTLRRGRADDQRRDAHADPDSLSELNLQGRHPGQGYAVRETPSGGSIDFDGNGRRVAPPATTPGRIVIEGPVGSGLKNQITIDVSTGGRVQIVTPTAWK